MIGGRKLTSPSYKAGFRNGFFSWPQWWYRRPMIKRLADKVKLLPTSESDLPDWEDYKRGFTKGAYAAWRLWEKIKENDDEFTNA